MNIILQAQFLLVGVDINDNLGNEEYLFTALLITLLPQKLTTVSGYCLKIIGNAFNT